MKQCRGTQKGKGVPISTHGRLRDSWSFMCQTNTDSCHGPFEEQKALKTNRHRFNPPLLTAGGPTTHTHTHIFSVKEKETETETQNGLALRFSKQTRPAQEAGPSFPDHRGGRAPLGLLADRGRRKLVRTKEEKSTARLNHDRVRQEHR